MSEYWSVFVWIAGIIFTLANAGLMNRLRMGINEAMTDKNIKELTASVNQIRDKVESLDRAIRGNGNPGMLERLGIACSELKDLARRVVSLEDTRNGNGHGVS